MRNLTIVLLCVAVAGAAFARGGSQQREEQVFRNVHETIEVAGEGWIDIGTAAGEINVRGWDRNEVEVTGRIGDDIKGVDLQFDPDSGDTQVRVALPEENNLANLNIDAFLTIHVPNNANVYVSSLGSRIDVQDVRGAIETRTATGEISIRGPARSIAAETLAGDITIVGPVDVVEFGVATGDVTIQNVERAVYGSTMDGAIRIESSTLEDAILSTLTGEIYLGGDVTPNARIQAIAQFGGSIEVELPVTVEALFTVNGGPAENIDMSEFNPLLPVEWVFGAPAGEGGDTRADRSGLPVRVIGWSLGRVFGEDGRVAISIGRSEDQDGRRTEVVPPDIDIAFDLPRLVDLVAVAREFRVGSGSARIILEVNGMVGTRGDDDNDGPRIILRTVQ